MVRFNKKAVRTEDKIARVAGPSVHIAVLGEADSGKTAVLTKFLNPSATIEPLNPENYWGSQMEPMHAQHSMNGVNIDFDEVMGSRGRMSNYYETRAALANADVIVHCQSAANYDKLETVVEQSEYATRRAKGLVDGVLSKVPIFCFLTMSDLSKDLVVPAKYEKDGVRYFAVSALTGHGIKEAMDAVLKTAMETKNAKRLCALAAKGEQPTAVAVDDTTTTTDTTAATDDDDAKKTIPGKSRAMLNKLLKLLGVDSSSEKSVSVVASTAAEPEVVESRPKSEGFFAISA